MENIIGHILRFTGRDLSVYADSFLQKIINKRIVESSVKNVSDYLMFLNDNPVEEEILLNSLNISYSLFFRNLLDFSIVERFIFPSLLQRNVNKQSSSIRIWSAGCADGSEAYSLAIIGNELMTNRLNGNPPLIFATDLSEKALVKARTGAYYGASLQNVTLNQLETWFTKTNQVYRVGENLKKCIEFSHYDLLDTKTGSPPSAIFGGFDLVTCCNVLVYYKREIQELILEKLYRSLGHKGFLMVDSSEKAIVKSFKGFRLYSALGNIFVKI
jgi:chemotaxis methyl-accepting protein methylase